MTSHSSSDPLSWGPERSRGESGPGSQVRDVYRSLDTIPDYRSPWVQCVCLGSTWVLSLLLSSFPYLGGSFC